MYIIETVVKNMKYWIRYDEASKSPWKTGMPQGLKNNASTFKSLADAETRVHLSKHHLKTLLEVVKL